MNYTEYLDENGAFVFVSCGISDGEVWMSVRQKSTTSGAHRIKSPRLPLQKTKEKAQQDLDAYAKSKGWRVYEPKLPAMQSVPQSAAPPKTDEKQIDLCGRCLPLFMEAFPFYQVTKGEAGKGKCGTCGKKRDIISCVFNRKAT